MTKKREPIDLVGRLAARIDLGAARPAVVPDPLPPQPRRTVAAPALALRAATAAAPAIDASAIEAPAVEARVIAESPPPLSGPTLVEPVLVESAPAAPVLVAPVLIDSPQRDQTEPHDISEGAEAQCDTAPRPGIGPQVEVDFISLQKEGYLTPRSQRTLTAEEYRIIKRPLLRHAFNHAEGNGLGHVIMITSARPGEGKTFTAINLAMSIATERDLFVLLVDCDIRRMGLSKKLGIADRKGLMDVLMEPTLGISDVLLHTNVPNLTLLPAGQPTEAATEIFASQGMSGLVDELASRYPDRFIIFDAPPVLASSEPGVLALHVGQTVMVVHANETSKRAVAQSIPLINSCPKVHFVLNQVTLAAGPDRFGYYGTY